MIFDVILLSGLAQKSLSYMESESESEKGIISGFTIEEIGDSFFDLLYNAQVFKNTNRFCLALQEQVFGTENHDVENFLSESLGPLFFNSSYFTLNGHPLVIILKSAKNGDSGLPQKKVTDVLKAIFSYLGYDNFYYCFVDRHKREVVSTNLERRLSIYDQEAGIDHDVKNWYLNFLQKSKDSQELILFFPPDSNSLSIPNSELKNAEMEFRNENPQAFALLEENIRFAKRLEQCEISVQVLREDLASRNAYIGVPRNALKMVSDFYHNEYEILPLWYKRFGHIIKVVIGKRTFRSLFNDKVKKYKD